MRRVAVTGMGIVSSIGNNSQEVLASLREARSGLVKAKDYAERGFRCQVHGEPQIDWEAMIDRKVRRFMGAGAGWNYPPPYAPRSVWSSRWKQDNRDNPSWPEWPAQSRPP